MNTRRPDFQRACAIYVHRFTLQHIPSWALLAVAPHNPDDPLKYYAPQFRTDREWYEHTKFPGEEGNPLVPGTADCYTTGQTWPLGQWLARPYYVGMTEEEARVEAPLPPVILSRAFLDQIKEFLELVQDPTTAADAQIDLHEAANVLEFKLDTLLKGKS